MTRKSVPKSNIGIFEGKEAEYNKQILKTLFIHGPLTAWEIAKKICGHKYPNISDFELEARSRRVYSVIQRKKGRLADLKQKEYIKAEKGKWKIEGKGGIAILIFDKKLVDRMYIEPLPMFQPILKKEVKVGPFKIDSAFINKIVKTAVDDSEKPKTALLFAEKTKEMLDEGIIDLDRISEDKLGVLVAKALAENGYHKELFLND